MARCRARFTRRSGWCARARSRPQLARCRGGNAANEATINVRLTSAEGLTGVQFDLEYDAAVLDVKVEVGAAAESAGKVLQTALPGPARQRVLVIGFNRNTLGSGVVAILHVALKENAARKNDAKTNTAVRPRYDIRLTESTGTNGEGQAVAVTGPNAVFTVEPTPSEVR